MILHITEINIDHGKVRDVHFMKEIDENTRNIPKNLFIVKK